MPKKLTKETWKKWSLGEWKGGESFYVDDWEGLTLLELMGDEVEVDVPTSVERAKDAEVVKALVEKFGIDPLVGEALMWRVDLDEEFLRELFAKVSDKPAVKRALLAHPNFPAHLFWEEVKRDIFSSANLADRWSYVRATLRNPNLTTEILEDLYLNVVKKLIIPSKSDYERVRLMVYFHPSNQPPLKDIIESELNDDLLRWLGERVRAVPVYLFEGMLQALRGLLKRGVWLRWSSLSKLKWAGDEAQFDPRKENVQTAALILCGALEERAVNRWKLTWKLTEKGKELLERVKREGKVKLTEDDVVLKQLPCVITIPSQPITRVFFVGGEGDGLEKGEA